jgi:2'-5' RNA ligase
MKAAFALLATTEIHNLVRKLSWDIHRKYRTGIDICRLPPHVSLKQPFEISELSSLEDYMTELAGSLEPFEVKLNNLQLIPVTMGDMDTGILWLDVEESQLLRETHDRLNWELTLRIGDVSAPFDGPDYHFHMTVAIGGQPIEAYRAIFNEFEGRLKDLQFIVSKLGMFVYDEIEEMNSGYILYKVMSLGMK